MHVDMVFAHHAFEDLDIFGITDLNQQVTTANLNVICQHMIAVLGGPNQMDG